jgi:hypothetical protein
VADDLARPIEGSARTVRLHLRAPRPLDLSELRGSSIGLPSFTFLPETFCPWLMKVIEVDGQIITTHPCLRM